MVELKLPDSTRRFLNGYNPNHGGLSDKFEPRKVDPEAIENYMNCFKEWNNAREPTNLPTEESYELISKYEPNLVDHNNIQDFVREVEDSYEELPKYAGIFLSYLFNELCPEKEITLEIEKPWNFLGFKNSKILEINGNCGYECGYWNEWEIVFDGNCDYGCGDKMKGGEIITNGDCGDWCGADKTGGKIVVNGYCGNHCGINMVGGKIYLNGNHGSIGDHSGGEIYHLGKIIYKNGKTVS